MDMISRQAAITIPVLPVEHRKYQTMNLDDAYDLGWFDCQKYIEELPSAQSERKTGRWKTQTIKGKQITYCSKCGFGKHVDETRRYSYCPNCGMRMEMKDDKR